MACASRSATDASATTTTPQILEAVENTVLMAHRDKRIMMVGMDEKGGLVVDVEVESDVMNPRNGGAGPPVAFDNKVDRSTREAAILGTALAKLIYPTLRIVMPHLFDAEVRRLYGSFLLMCVLTL
jgi:hypothetical protein